jgi:hypothetical protein
VHALARRAVGGSAALIPPCRIIERCALSSPENDRTNAVRVIAQRGAADVARAMTRFMVIAGCRRRSNYRFVQVDSGPESVDAVCQIVSRGNQPPKRMVSLPTTIRS